MYKQIRENKKRKNPTNKADDIMPKLHLSLLNIRGQRNKCLELQHTINQLPHYQKPHVLAITETWEDENKDIFKMKGYTWAMGKPGSHPNQNVTSGRLSGGLGLWIKDSIYGRWTLLKTTTENDNIAWFKYVGHTETLNLGIIYSRPNDITNHNVALQNLTDMIEEVSSDGPLVIMGDFNSHTKLSNGKGHPLRPSHVYDQTFTSFLGKNGLSQTTNQNQINSQTHWTFNSPSGKSVNDHILTKSPQRVTGYSVHQKHNVGSDHRLITFQVTMNHTQETWSWGQRQNPKIIWDTKSIKTYKSFLDSTTSMEPLNRILNTPINPGLSISEKSTEITTLADIFLKVVQNSIKSITPESNKSKNREGPHTNLEHLPREVSEHLNKLMTTKQKILNDINHTPHSGKGTHTKNSTNTTEKRKNTINWDKIKEIQKEIQVLTKSYSFEKQKLWWNKLKASPHPPDSKEFWEEAKKILPNKAEQPPFPTMMIDEKNRLLTTKSEITAHIIETYTNISVNRDPVAISHQKSMSPQFDTPTAEEKSRTSNKEKNQPTNILCSETITREELEQAISKSKNGKKPGYDSVVSEALINLTQTATSALLVIMKRMWVHKFTPKAWKIALIKLHHKDGPRDNILNYRPITLLTAIFKIWERILEQRTRKITETLFPNTLQMGSQKKNSAHAATMVTKGLHLLAREQGHDIFSASVDMNKAYNRVNRSKLWSILKRMGITGTLLSNIMATYTKAEDKIMIGATISQPFHLEAGLRQGSILSPLLYILYTSNLLENLEKTNTGIKIKTPNDHKFIPAIMFVDDLETYATSMTDLITQLITINDFVTYSDSIINHKKSSISSTIDFTELEQELVSKGIPYKGKKQSVHLGCAVNLGNVNNTNQMQRSPDVNRRIAIANSTLTTMIHNGLREGAIQISPAIHIVESVLLHQLLHGLTHATLTKADRTALDGIMAKAARSIFGMDNKQLIPDKWILRDTGMSCPTEQLYIKDVKFYLDTLAGRLNPTVTALIKYNFPRFTTSCSKSLHKWGLTLNEASCIPNKDVSKHLQRFARKVPLNLTHPLASPSTEEQLQVNANIKAYIKKGIPTTLLPIYMETRAYLHLGNKNQNEICPYCPTFKSHTYLHCINDCVSNTLLRRQIIKKPNPIPYITQQTLIHLLGGQTNTDQTESKSKADMIYVLSLIENSHILNPPKVNPN
jgi:hypothetical protein